MDDLEGLEMETKEIDRGDHVHEASVHAKTSSVVEGREGFDNGANSGASSVNQVVLISASHPDLLEGARQVNSGGLEAAGNPKGQGILRRMKEKVFKDVTNNLETGSVSLKPNSNRLRFGLGVAIREGVLLKNKTHKSKDYVNGHEPRLTERIYELCPIQLDRLIYIEEERKKEP